MKSQNTKSSDELQKEVRHEIHNVRRDLNELSGRLSPGQLIDDVIFYPHGRSPAATFDHLKRNPVGTAFLSLGTILLMENESHQTLESLSKDKIESAKQKMNMGPSKKELTMDKVNEFRDRIDELKAEVEYKVAEVRDKVDTVKETVKVPEIDNVTFMALGAGLGIITGASLPVSETERAFVDSKLQGKLSDFSKDLQAAINECSNILKDLVIADVKDLKVNLF